MGTKDYLISVIMPVYKVEPFIAASIKSVLAQTHSNFELLVIDDGSPDRSVEIAKEFQDNDHRVQIFHKPNGGLSDARNYGLDRASGDFVYFIDSDDWVEPDLLELALKAILEFNSDIVVFGYQQDILNLNGDLQASRKVSVKENSFSRSRKNLDINADLMGILGYAWNKLYRRDFLENNELRFEKGVSLVEDILFNAKVYALVDQIVILSNTGYHYMDRPVATLIKMFHSGSFELFLRKCTAIKNFLDAWAVPEAKKQEILANCLINGLRYCGNNLIVYGSNLSELEKLNHFKTMVYHPQTQNLVVFYKANSNSDRVYKYLIQFKSAYLLFNILKLKK